MPIELLSLLGGVITGMIKSFFSSKHELEKQRNAIMLAQMSKDMEVREQVMNGPDSGSRGWQWTRRLIALQIVFVVFVLPKLAALSDNAPDLIYAWSEKTAGFLFFSGATIQHWTIMNGIVNSPIDTHAAMAVIGLYFGSSLPTGK